MKKLMFLLILIVFGAMIFSVLFYVQPRNDLTSMYVDKLNNASVEKVFHSFWIAAYKGNAAEVRKVSDSPPNDLFKDCIGDKTVFTKNNQYSLGENNKEKNKKLIKIKKENVSDNFNNISSYIFASKISVDRVRIMKKTVFGDEAILDISIADSQGNYSFSNELLFFLERQNQVWKVVAYLEKDLSSFNYNNIKYATPRPACE